MNKRMVLDYMPLAIKMARMKSLSAPPCVSFEELESAAYMGLVDAASRFDPERGFSFASFARARIDGEMKDYMRLSLVGKRVRLIAEGEDFPADEKDSDQNLAFSCLNERESKILRLYYIDDIGMKEIGLSEGISESRISQILDSCRKKIKRHLVRKSK